MTKPDVSMREMECPNGKDELVLANNARISLRGEQAFDRRVHTFYTTYFIDSSIQCHWHLN
jgi:hypothetical protein